MRALIVGINFGKGDFEASMEELHLLVQSDDLRKVNLAFFTTNGIASVAYSLFLIGDMLLR